LPAHCALFRRLPEALNATYSVAGLITMVRPVWRGYNRATFFRFVGFRIKDMVQNPIEKSVEILCERGCVEVRRAIADLEAGREVSGIGHLTEEERRAVLDELREVMMPYGDSCPSER